MSVALFLLLLFVAGFWMLSQTLDATVILGRNFVNLPFYPLPIDVWTYHDLSYSLLWLAFLGLVVWVTDPWRPHHITRAGVTITVFGFALLTAGLWLAQDTMNAVLVLHRNFVDLPFFFSRVDIEESRDISILLVVSGFLEFYTLFNVPYKE